MRIAVMATGGVGGYFGAKLAQGGHEVSFVARGRHLAAMRERGLAVKSANGDIRIAQPRLVEDPTALESVDVVLFAVKLWDTESAAAAIAGVMGGAAYIAATIAEPGVVAHTGTMARLRFGPVIASQRSAAEKLLAACQGAGIDAELSADIRRAIWEKFSFLAAFSGMTSVCRQPLGVVRGDPDARSALESAIREVWALARVLDIGLADDFVAQQMKFADGLPAEMKSSMQNDLAAGNRLEAPWLCGAVARMATAAGIAAPVNATLYAALKPYCAGAAPSGNRP